MTKHKAIIFDIDGTAIDSPDHQLPSQRVVDAIKNAESSYYLCAATGRVWSFVEPVVKALELVDPCIVSAGTQICDPITGEVLWQYDIEPAHLDAVIEIVEQYPDYKALFNDYDEATYFQGASMQISKINKQPVYFLGLIFVPEDKATEIVARFSKLDGISCTLALAQRPGYNDILITNRGATKYHAIVKLLEILEVSKKDTIGIGDGHNDIHLFQAVEQKVAMGNAVPELKELADTVIDNIKADGMASYLESLVKL